MIEIDAFRFLFDINGQVEHLRFTRVPFGVEASPFMLCVQEFCVKSGSFYSLLNFTKA
jgi:hypothetical protein